MGLLKEERIELVLLSGHEGWSYQKIADVFKACHPRRVPIDLSKVGKVSEFNVELIHQVHMNLAKCNKLCIANGRNHIEDVVD